MARANTKGARRNLPRELAAPIRSSIELSFQQEVGDYVSQELMRRLLVLRRHYGVNKPGPGSWIQLSLRLAMDKFRGFQVDFGGKSVGRPSKKARLNDRIAKSVSLLIVLAPILPTIDRFPVRYLHEYPNVLGRVWMPMQYRNGLLRARLGRLLGGMWWRRRESNPRPQALGSQDYMLSQVI